MLRRFGLRSDPVADRAGWEGASPLFLPHVDAPPFFVLHGTHDSLIPIEDTRHFVAALRAVSTSPVAYVELPGAQHAFDMFNSVRALGAVEGVGRWLDVVRQRAEDSAAKDSLTQSA
jgi:acetyl esterase/lipase